MAKLFEKARHEKTVTPVEMVKRFEFTFDFKYVFSDVSSQIFTLEIPTAKRVREIQMSTSRGILQVEVQYDEIVDVEKEVLERIAGEERQRLILGKYKITKKVLSVPTGMHLPPFYLRVFGLWHTTFPCTLKVVVHYEIMEGVNNGRSK